MLVLTRKENEEIWIDGGKIKVKVVAIIKGRVRLGVIASHEVAIDRQEVAEARAQFRTPQAEVVQ
jgi:carbon storage regulator CsrA